MFMIDGKGPKDLPKQCWECYGYSKWDGPIEEIVYADRDCSTCVNKPIG